MAMVQVFVLTILVQVWFISETCSGVPTSTQQDMIKDGMSNLEEKIGELKMQMDEIIHSFNTLELIANNPSAMAQIGRVQDDAMDQTKGILKTRYRRDDGPDEASTPTQSGPVLGPFSYPLFSGQCFLCPEGVPGPRGQPGPAGMTGRDGRDGRDATEDAKPCEHDPDDDDVQPQTQPNENQEIGGVVYTRWGNSECADGSELVYSGTAGGAHYTNTGGGSNYLCMPHVPIYDEVETTLHSNRARLYSSEYETDDAPSRLQSREEHTPTCAVCRAPPGRTSKLMVPARNVCPTDNWRLEYKGYLMAQRYNEKRTEFICMDREMESEPGTGGNEDGALFYMVEGRCLQGGGLPCGPYVDGYELTCAVCTI